MAISIPKILAKALGKQTALGFRAMTLTKSTPGTRTVGAVSAGTNPTTTSYACKGFEETKQAGQLPETLVVKHDLVISLLGASIASGAVPVPGDRITSLGVTYTIIPEGVGRDPVGALYVCTCRK